MRKYSIKSCACFSGTLLAMLDRVGPTAARLDQAISLGQGRPSPAVLAGDVTPAFTDQGRAMSEQFDDKILSRRGFLKAGALGGMAAMGTMLPGRCMGSRFRQAGTRRGEDRLHPADRLLVVVMASVMGFDKKYGIKITPSKEASWAGVRDKLANGELHAAHVLYGLSMACTWASAVPRRTWPC
jgi:hypothetical protein